MEVVSQSSSIGAEIRDLDLSSGLTQAQYEELNQAFLDYQIIFIRDQHLTSQQYVDFASHFGPPREYLFAEGIDGFSVITEIVKTETETESFGSFWHSDSTYMARPPKATILYARQVPPKGGDTLFSDMYSAYEGLSEGLRKLLAPLHAINSASVFSRDEDIYQEVKSKNSECYTQQAIHPVIRVHDETGRKALYVNSIHTLCFEGMTRDESMPILELLYECVQKPEYAFRLQWQQNTIAMWDNRCTQHFAVNDYHGYRRVMHRIIVEGDQPQ